MTIKIMISARFTPHQQGIIAMIFANIIWGAAPAIFKLALVNITPFTLAFLRFFVASLILFPFAASDLHIPRKDWLALIGMSLFGITINISFFFFGLLWAPSVNAAIIATSAPLFLFLAALFFLHEKPNKKILLGMLIGIIGISLVIGQPVLDDSGPMVLLGNLFFILATMGSIGYTLIGKSLASRYPPMTLTFWTFFIGSVTFFPFFAYEGIYYHPLSSLNQDGVVGLVFGIFFSSALAYYLFHWGLKKLQTQEVGLFASVDPIVAAFFSVLLLGEPLTTGTIIGCLFVMAGLIVAELHFPYRILRTWKYVKQEVRVIAGLAVQSL